MEIIASSTVSFRLMGTELFKLMPNSRVCLYVCVCVCVCVCVEGGGGTISFIPLVVLVYHACTVYMHELNEFCALFTTLRKCDVSY